MCHSSVNIFRQIEGSAEGIESWPALLKFGEEILLAPTRAGKRHNLAKLIKNRASGDTSDKLSEGSSTGTRK